MPIRHNLDFRVLAAAALLLSAMLGFFVGMTGNRTPVAAVGSIISGPERTLPFDTAQRPGLPHNTPPPTNPDTQPEPKQPPPLLLDRPVVRIEKGTARVLAPGRVDALERGPDFHANPGSIRVMLRDDRGSVPAQAWAALDARAGSVGWRNTGVSPVAVRGERGVVLFEEVPPGEYRVRAVVHGHAPAMEPVTVVSEQERQVVITLRRTENARVDFFVRLESGGIPEQVQVSVDRGNEADSGEGRFGDHGRAGSGGAGRLFAPVRYHTPVGTNGLVRVNVGVGVPTKVSFTAELDGIAHVGEELVTPRMDNEQVHVTLRPGGEIEPRQPQEGGSHILEVLLTVNGSHDVAFERVNLRRRPTDVSYRAAHEQNGNLFAWSDLPGGRWLLVAEVRSLHAPFATYIDVGSSGRQTFDIATGHLRVTIERESGSPDPQEGNKTCRIRILTLGVGPLSRSYNRVLTGKAGDAVDFMMPPGEFEVHVEAAQQGPPVTVEPNVRAIEIRSGQRAELAFTARAAATLRFRCVDSSGAPLPFAEFLVTLHPAGSAPETEKQKVRRTGADGWGETTDAPYGPVYLHVWSESSAWQAPDKVFRIEFPAYGVLDLGPVVIRP